MTDDRPRRRDESIHDESDPLLLHLSATTTMRHDYHSNDYSNDPQGTSTIALLASVPECHDLSPIVVSRSRSRPVVTNLVLDGMDPVVTRPDHVAIPPVNVVTRRHHGRVRRRPSLMAGHQVTRILGPVSNLCSATLGAGILAVPYAVFQAG
jgi:hypothetical protein